MNITDSVTPSKNPLVWLAVVLICSVIATVQFASATKRVDSTVVGVTRPVPDAAHRTLHGRPFDYLSVVKTLQAGDTLELAPGIYDDPTQVPGLPLFDLHGAPDRPITIEGPDAGPRPVFRARAEYNTIRLKDASYIILRNLEIDGRKLDVDGVKAQGITHHVTLEHILIYNQGDDQQTDGISTKGPAWDWIIRDAKFLTQAHPFTSAIPTAARRSFEAS